MQYASLSLGIIMFGIIWIAAFTEPTTYTSQNLSEVKEPTVVVETVDRAAINRAVIEAIKSEVIAMVD